MPDLEAELDVSTGSRQDWSLIIPVYMKAGLFKSGGAEEPSSAKLRFQKKRWDDMKLLLAARGIRLQWERIQRKGEGAGYVIGLLSGKVVTPVAQSQIKQEDIVKENGLESIGIPSIAGIRRNTRANDYDDRQMTARLEHFREEYVEEFLAFMGEEMKRDIGNIKEARKVIHTRTVDRAIASRSQNRVLDGVTPEVNEEEESLPRGARTTLAQLRSGYCSSLNDLRHRIGLTPSLLCPCCRQEEHTVRHLFQCDSHPTTLTPTDLWRRPETALRFLRDWPCFERIDPERPPPEPPPSHPTTRGAGL